MLTYIVVHCNLWLHIIYIYMYVCTYIDIDSKLSKFSRDFKQRRWCRMRIPSNLHVWLEIHHFQKDINTEIDTLLWWMLKAAKFPEKPWTSPNKARQFWQTCSRWPYRLPTSISFNIINPFNFTVLHGKSCRWSPSSAFCRIRTC